MECLSQMWSIVPCLWECSSKHAAYVRRLEDNLNSLRNAMDSLNNLSQDVRNSVHDAQQQHKRLRNQVTGWLRKVEALEKKVNSILVMGTQEVENKCAGSCCPKNYWASYKLGKKVTRMIPEVRGLTDEGRFDDVADDDLVVAPVDELPMEGPVVGFESKFEEVWQSVQDKDSSIIGLVGIGGVGKTTLLKQLNNEFLKTMHGFDLVIWIVVSKSTDLGRIQDIIRNKLNISNRLWESKKNMDERVSLIYTTLKKRKFVVLLDDLWDRLKLSDAGIPIPQRGRDNMSKIVFTTRSEEVCWSLDAHKMIKVGCLPQDQALNLFITKAGEDILKSHPHVQQLVKDVASECGGLPLALITIGRAMRGKTDTQQWKEAKRTLMTYPSTFPGVKGEIFAKLIFSYDCLPTQTIKKCFEYCSIFPEDHEISKENLIRLWIGEGIIDEYGNIYDALIQGRQLIANLLQACLLEVGKWDDVVKMHDVIRDMALWVACGHGEKKNKFLVVDEASGCNHGLSGITQCRNAEKVSLWGRGITGKCLAGLSLCSNLVTLIIRSTDLQGFPTKFLPCMKTLKVLDLQGSPLTELSGEIGSLINLEYLNITNTLLERLPEEVKKLKKLRFFLVDRATLIPRGVLSNLWLLQTFEQHCDRIYQSDYGADLRLEEMERELIVELEGLEHTMYLSLVICKVASVQTLLDSPKLRSCTKQLHLFDCLSFPAELNLSTEGRLMEHLEKLHLKNCNMSALNVGSSSSSLRNLRHISISNCGRIRNVSSLIYVPNLCTLHVVDCDSMVELIGENELMMKKKMEESNINDSFDDTSTLLLFSCLTSLRLHRLSNLRSICPLSALPFPSLKVLEVESCYNLKKLPFDLKTAKTTPPEFKILGDELWWNYKLQWDRKSTKDAFSPKFQLQQEFETTIEISYLN